MKYIAYLFIAGIPGGAAGFMVYALAELGLLVWASILAGGLVAIGTGFVRYLSQTWKAPKKEKQVK